MAALGNGLIRIRVNPYYYEPILQEQIDDGIPGLDGSHTLHADAINDMDFVRQLCNGAQAAEPSKMDPDRHLWVKRWANEPNDFRDCRKYARCLMDWKFERDWRRAARRQGAVVQRPAVREQPQPSEDQRRERGRFRPTSRRARMAER